MRAELEASAERGVEPPPQGGVIYFGVVPAVDGDA